MTEEAKVIVLGTNGLVELDQAGTPGISDLVSYVVAESKDIPPGFRPIANLDYEGRIGAWDATDDEDDFLAGATADEVPTACSLENGACESCQ